MQEYGITTDIEYKCWTLILKYRIEIVASNLWYSVSSVDWDYWSLRQLHTIEERCACSKKKNIHTGNKYWRNYFLDTTGSFPESLIGNRYWIDVVEKYNCYYWSLFMKIKHQLPKEMADFPEKTIPHGTLVKYLRCRNSGEHQSKFQKILKKENFIWNTRHPTTAFE